jgi:hypothetical protein
MFLSKADGYACVAFAGTFLYRVQRIFVFLSYVNFANWLDFSIPLSLRGGGKIREIGHSSQCISAPS